MIIEHHAPSKKKQHKKKSRDNDNWRNRQEAKSRAYDRKKDRYNAL